MITLIDGTLVAGQSNESNDQMELLTYRRAHRPVAVPHLPSRPQNNQNNQNILAATASKQIQPYQLFLKVQMANL